VLSVLNKIEGVPRRLIILGLVSTDLAINRIREAYPNVEIYTYAIDPRLNENGFIVPGLGDRGDRAFEGDFISGAC
jgi:uracil phosphoribosyltransferase